MSLATRTGQITFLQKSGTITPSIVCDMGDLYQEFDGESSDPINIAPDFASMKPTLSFQLVSSRVAEGNVVPSKVEWYFNDVKLSFGSNNVSTTSFSGETGHFKQIPYAAGSVDYYGLQIVKNLVKASEGASCTIKCIATAVIGNLSDDIACVYPIPITRGVGNQKVVTIAMGDNKAFALRDKGDSCVLKAVVRQGADEITSGLTYKWFKQNAGSWTDLSVTSQTLTVTGDMVDSSAVFKVEVYQGGSRIGMDTQTVQDLSDPLDIITNPDPADETIESGSGGSVTYSPILVKRGSTAKFKDMTFYFVFMDSAGNILNTSTSGTASATGTCTEEMCVQAGGNVNYNIQTSE